MNPTTTDMGYVRAPGMTHATTIIAEDGDQLIGVRREILVVVAALWDMALETTGTHHLTVGEVATLLGVPQPRVAQILARLAYAGYLTAVPVDVEVGWGFAYKIPQDVRTPAPKESRR